MLAPGSGEVERILEFSEIGLGKGGTIHGNGEEKQGSLGWEGL